jgi:DNA polymerase III delta prime subunit
MHLFLILFFIINFTFGIQTAYSQQMSLAIDQSPISAEKIIAKIPIRSIANQLFRPLKLWLHIIENPCLIRDSERSTAWLFHGEPGTGKTTLAKIIADETNCHYIFVNTASLVTQFQGSGSEALSNIIENAKKLIGTDNKKGVVICLDEMHAIANTINSAGTNNDNAKTLDRLYGIMHEITDQPILIIGTTNYLENIPASCKSRFQLYRFDKLSFESRQSILYKRLFNTDQLSERTKRLINTAKNLNQFTNELMPLTDSLKNLFNFIQKINVITLKKSDINALESALKKSLEKYNLLLQNLSYVNFLKENSIHLKFQQDLAVCFKDISLFCIIFNYQNQDKTMTSRILDKYKNKDFRDIGDFIAQLKDTLRQHEHDNFDQQNAAVNKLIAESNLQDALFKEYAQGAGNFCIKAFEKTYQGCLIINTISITIKTFSSSKQAPHQIANNTNELQSSAPQPPSSTAKSDTPNIAGDIATAGAVPVATYGCGKIIKTIGEKAQNINLEDAKSTILLAGTAIAAHPIIAITVVAGGITIGAIAYFFQRNKKKP